MQGLTQGNYKLKVLKISAIAIFSVVIVEISLGLIVNSLAIVSDGLHALLDALSTIMLFFAVRASIKPPDEEHTYGHEKFETIGGLMGGITLVGVAIIIFYEAANRLMQNTHVSSNFQFVGFVAIAYALSIASLRVTVFRKTQHVESPSMKAGLYDAISDLSSTLIALLGFALATIGFFYGDAIASVFLGIMLSYLSIRLVKFSIMELSDTASKDIIEKTRKLILSQPDVVKTGNLKARKVSSKIFIDATLQVATDMSLEQAHSLASKIEEEMKKALGNVDATIHIEPSEKQTKMNELVRRLAAVEGIKEVHEISTIITGGKLYITLHVYVNPELSVEEAHKIAEKIEQKMKSEIKPLENITVHVEPAGVAVPATNVDEAKIETAIYEIAQSVGTYVRIKKIVTYVAEGKRYINIDCCFTRQIQIKEAHKIASLIEKQTKDRFSGAIVTVHIEPECEK